MNGMKPDEPTWDLDRFRAAYEADDNQWWGIGCGHHQNLFEAACERLDALAAENERLRTELAEQAEQIAQAIATYVVAIARSFATTEPEDQP